jgi:hypothetical protein
MVRARKTRNRVQENVDFENWTPGNTLWEREEFNRYRDIPPSDLTKLIQISESEVPALNSKMKTIAYNYWAVKNDVVSKPSAAWYRSKLSAIEKAAQRLLEAIRDCKGTSRGALEYLFNKETGIDLVGSFQRNSMEKYLLQLQGACKRAYPHRTVGAKETKHVKEAVKSLVEIWEFHNGRKFPTSLSTAPARRDGEPESQHFEAFTNKAPNFVHQAMIRIDPEVSPSTVRTALRSCLKKKYVPK